MQVPSSQFKIEGIDEDNNAQEIIQNVIEAHF